MTTIVRPTRIIILGGGFGGIYTALALDRLHNERTDLEVVLVSRENYLTMTPLLFEAASGILEPRHAVQPVRSLFRRARFVEADVEHIDLERRIVFARPSVDEIYELPYDHLVLAMGGVTNRALVPGSEHAMTFKTLADAIFLRNYTIELFERADVEPDAERKKALLTFVIIGGGLVGIELMGELTTFTRNLCRSYRHVDPDELRFELLEAGPHVMAEMDRDLADYAAEVLERRGVRIRTQCPAKRMGLDRVELPSGETIMADTIILAAGVAPNPLLKDLPMTKDRRGRIAVDATMQVPSHPGVWALGDCAAIPDPSGKPY
ncbi:MAG: NAD(P)/FAD-dependent oxidoreductase, partial [Bacillota bacterium]